MMLRGKVTVFNKVKTMNLFDTKIGDDNSVLIRNIEASLGKYENSESENIKRQAAYVRSQIHHCRNQEVEVSVVSAAFNALEEMAK